MTEENTKKIIAYVDFTDVTQTVINHSVKLAEIFNAELSLIHVIDDNTYRMFKKKDIVEKTKQELEKIKANIKQNHSINSSVSYEEGCACEIINSSAEEQSAILIVIGLHPKNELQYLTPSSALKVIRKSRIPYLVVQKGQSYETIYDNIILPINHLKEAKEKVSWAAYFSKLNKSEINIITTQTPDEYVNNNLKFANKFLKQFNQNHTTYNIAKNIIVVDKAALNYASKTKSGLLIIMNTKKYSLLDYLIGPKEKAIIANKYNIPVLSLNPRDDLFIPCV